MTLTWSDLNPGRDTLECLDVTMAAMNAVMALHRERWPNAPITHCAHDGQRWPCQTMRTVRTAVDAEFARISARTPTSTGATA